MRNDQADEINCAHDKLVAVEELKPNPRNPNRHSPEQVAFIAKLIGLRGWRAPITVSNLSGMVVAGHGRLEAAKQLDLGSVPVDFQEFASEEDELAHMVADNRLAELSTMDNDALDALLSELSVEEIDVAFDFEQTGFTREQHEQLSKALKPLEYTTEKVRDAGEGQSKRKFEAYENSTVRQIILIYSTDEYEEVCARLDKIKSAHNCETNTDAVTLAIQNMVQEVA